MALLLLILATIPAFGGCLFTDPINMPPSIEIQPVGPVWRGDAVTFTAIDSDPNGDRVEVRWTHVLKNPRVGGTSTLPYECPAGSNAYADPTRWPTSPTMTTDRYPVLPADTDGTFCVWAFAQDRHGAVRAAQPREVVPMNHDPVAAIAVGTTANRPACLQPLSTTSFGHFDTVVFSGECSDDSDMGDEADFSFSWRLVGMPVGSAAALTACPEGDASQVRCLVADTEGAYEVELTVDDGHGGTSQVTRTVSVARDAFPCLHASFDNGPSDPAHLEVLASPDLMTGVDPPHFQIDSVDDDADSLPAKGDMRPTYYWFVALGDESLTSARSSLVVPFYDEPRTRKLGDVVRVRVEVRDRQVQEIGDALAACDGEVCALDPARPACLQRMTWTLRYNL